MRNVQAAMGKTLIVIVFLSFACAVGNVPNGSARGRLGFDPANFDPSIRACDDFYGYANGQWLATHPVPLNEAVWGMASTAIAGNETTLRQILEDLSTGPDLSPDDQKLGDFYASCMDTKSIDAGGLTPIRADLDRIDHIGTERDLTDLFARLASYGISQPFAFRATKDPSDSRRVFAEVAQGELGLSEPNDYLAEMDEARALRTEYEHHVAAMLHLAGLNGQAAAVVRIETALARAMFTRVQRRASAKATVHRMTVEELSRFAPKVDWPRFFAESGAPDLVALNVAEPDFVRAVDSLIASTSLDDWRGWLRWCVLRNSATWLPAPIAAEAFRFNGVLTGQKDQQARWRQCVAATDSALGEALGRQYVSRRFSPAAKGRVEELVRNIVAAMREDIETNDWMSDSTRKEALAKLDALRWKIGFPERWRDFTALTIERRPFASNVLAAQAFEVRRELSGIGKPADRTEWAMTPQTWNAYNNYENNEIVFPAALLQWPRFDPLLDDAFNYGSIGSVIGHELTHGFDDLGRQWDAGGNVRDWWAQADAARFEERANCIIRQFAGFEAAPGLHHDGKLVAGESIADLGGLSIAWRAWKRSLRGKPLPPVIDGFTAEQRFFLAYAQARALNMRPEIERRTIAGDTHPLSRLRVIGPLSNMPEFSAAFGCHADDPMVRKERCRIW